MGLILARAGAAMGGPGIQASLGLGLGAAAATGIVMAGQYAYGGDFSTPQSKPEGMNWTTAGAGAVVGGIAAIAGGINWSDNGSIAGKRLRSAGIGFAAGAVVGAMLIAPTIRRMQAES